MIHLISPVLEEPSSFSDHLRSRLHRGGDSSISVSPELHLAAEQLTRKEIELLRLMSEENTPQDIAHRLFPRLPTVRTHVQNVLGKLQVHSRIERLDPLGSVPSLSMPAFESRLTGQQIDDLIAHLVSLYPEGEELDW